VLDESRAGKPDNYHEEFQHGEEYKVLLLVTVGYHLFFMEWEYGKL
jgi:hypothetical protein